MVPRGSLDVFSAWQKECLERSSPLTSAARSIACIGVVIPTLGTRPDLLVESIKSIRAVAEESGVPPVILHVVVPSGIELSPVVESMIDQRLDDPGTGAAAAINLGISSFPESVKFVAWLGDDDLLVSGALGTTWKRLQADSEAVAAFGGCEYISSSGHTLLLNRSGRWAVPLMRIGPQLLPQPGSLLRRSAFERVGGLNESLKWAFDLDLFIRLMKIGDLAFVRQTVARFRWHPGSLTAGQRRGSINEASCVRVSHLPRALRDVSPVWEAPMRAIIYWRGEFLSRTASKSEHAT